MERGSFRIALLYRGPQGQGKDEFSSFVPVGLLNVLKSLRTAGYRASLYNLSETPERALAKAIGGTCAKAFLISAFFGCHHEAFRLARIAKKLDAASPVILGGPLSVLGGAILAREPAIDFLIRGEGEEAAVALLDSLLFSRKARPDISGLVSRHKGGSIEVPPRLLMDIDRHFFLPSEVLPYCHGVRPENLAIVISSRGCPFHCAFCSSTVLWKNRVRHHSVALLLAYLKDLRAVTGAIYFSLRDENFLTNREHVFKFTEALRASGLNYLWNAQGSLHLLDEKMADQLAEAGCDQVQMGIEAVSPRLLALLGKGGDPSRIGQAIAILRSRLIRPFGYFIYGMGESEAEGKESLDCIRKSGLIDAVASPLVLYPGTRLSRGIGPGRFLAAGELLLYDQKSAGIWKKRYESTLAALYARGGFRAGEIKAANNPGLVGTVARYFFFLGQGKEKEAAEIARRLVREEPQNPWGRELLAGLGKKKKGSG